ncbi:hypothetical protein COU97_00280 [Candidatus Shapirobacteria bacterium CG10_big_fil_rev_8_21_14_0_10_48_15]|uniref:Uncharacterized protein n=1 Tax=Candidatus Shapirobacteria bacterium CG10_big_fil_rev_8_21_14_0_10_48_15 TaxID=1974484 RepID=A0A2M8L7Z9_9BACT|nr:MAG: hypothetical protein COU97_00280 [Candidatus Shapirobacteria bacterium CG10_big_fil_rev_8_21_14_0_10_48_15]
MIFCAIISLVLVICAEEVQWKISIVGTFEATWCGHAGELALQEDQRHVSCLSLGKRPPGLAQSAQSARR